MKQKENIFHVGQNIFNLRTLYYILQDPFGSSFSNFNFPPALFKNISKAFYYKAIMLSGLNYQLLIDFCHLEQSKDVIAKLVIKWS